jgi:acyl-CoA synthetase (AMP-forming)/AMP-acid ligase II
VVIFGGDVPVTSTGKYQRSRCRDFLLEWKTTQFKEKE